MPAACNVCYKLPAIFILLIQRINCFFTLVHYQPLHSYKQHTNKMKKTTLLLAFLTLLFSACTKVVDDEYEMPNYRVDGITDISVYSTGATNMPLNVVYMNSEQERVDLSLDGLPAGMTATFTPASGIPTYSSFLQIRSNNTAAGNYPVTLVANGAESGRRTYSFNIRITECASELLGTYTGFNACFAGGSYVDNITAVAGQPNTIQFNNFENTGARVIATVDCGTSRLTIPTQVVNGITYSTNSGFFNITTTGIFINFNYRRVSAGGGVANCNVNLNK